LVGLGLASPPPTARAHEAADFVTSRLPDTKLCAHREAHLGEGQPWRYGDEQGVLFLFMVTVYEHSGGSCYPLVDERLVNMPPAALWVRADIDHSPPWENGVWKDCTYLPSSAGSESAEEVAGWGWWWFYPDAPCGYPRDGAAPLEDVDENHYRIWGEWSVDVGTRRFSGTGSTAVSAGGLRDGAMGVAVADHNFRRIYHCSELPNLCWHDSSGGLPHPLVGLPRPSLTLGPQFYVPGLDEIVSPPATENP
jgi:hypothetical protein